MATGAACSRSAPPADQVGPPAAPQGATGPAAEAQPAEPSTPADVQFSVEPGVVHACEGQDRVTSTVRWDVTRPGVNAVKVLVSDATNPEKKTLANMAPKGEAATGDWVTQGVLFELVDADTGALLASYTVTSLPCN